MIFQDAPTAFDWIVLAVIGWIVRQPDRDAIQLHKLNQPLHKLRPTAMVLWTIIYIDHQGGDLGEPPTDCLPPLDEAIHQASTGHFGRDPIHKQLAQGWEEAADGRYRCLGRKVVVGSFDVEATLPAPGAGANFDSRFGIHRDAQDVVCRISGVIDLGYLREDGVGFWDFFCG
jgi:hypothetical protein